MHDFRHAGCATRMKMTLPGNALSRTHYAGGSSPSSTPDVISKHQFPVIYHFNEVCDASFHLCSRACHLDCMLAAKGNQLFACARCLCAAGLHKRSEAAASDEGAPVIQQFVCQPSAGIRAEDIESI